MEFSLIARFASSPRLTNGGEESNGRRRVNPVVEVVPVGSIPNDSGTRGGTCPPVAHVASPGLATARHRGSCAPEARDRAGIVEVVRRRVVGGGGSAAIRGAVTTLGVWVANERVLWQASREYRERRVIGGGAKPKISVRSSSAVAPRHSCLRTAHPHELFLAPARTTSELQRSTVNTPRALHRRPGRRTRKGERARTSPIDSGASCSRKGTCVRAGRGCWTTGSPSRSAHISNGGIRSLAGGVASGGVAVLRRRYSSSYASIRRGKVEGKSVGWGKVEQERKMRRGHAKARV